MIGAIISPLLDWLFSRGKYRPTPTPEERRRSEMFLEFERRDHLIRPDQ